MNDSEDCVEDVNTQLDKLCAVPPCTRFTQQPADSRCNNPFTLLLCLARFHARSGYNIGTRLVDEYFAKTGAVRAAHRHCAVESWHAHSDVCVALWSHTARRRDGAGPLPGLPRRRGRRGEGARAVDPVLPLTL